MCLRSGNRVFLKINDMGRRFCQCCPPDVGVDAV